MRRVFGDLEGEEDALALAPEEQRGGVLVVEGDQDGGGDVQGDRVGARHVGRSGKKFQAGNSNCVEAPSGQAGHQQLCDISSMYISNVLYSVVKHSY